MTRLSINVPLSSVRADQLETTVKVLAHNEKNDYYSYEREGIWYIGIGSHASLIIDPKGETATTIINGKEDSRPFKGIPLADIARDFISNGSALGGKVFGHVGFNYAAHSRGQNYNAGQWPLVSLMFPRTEITLHDDCATVAGYDDETVRQVCDIIKNGETYDAANPQNMNINETADEYIERVSRALAEIAEGRYTKVIPSRPASFEKKVDMPATLLHGRRANNPKRTFSLNHAGFQATGFSPELVVSVDNGKIMTEPLAGTRSRNGMSAEEEKRLCEELLNDPKEIVEHIISVKEAISELNRLCPEETVVVEDLMSVRPRGSVQHLGSSVTGYLDEKKDFWDAFDVLFPSITASGIPKAPALEGIQRLESQPRELYSGAVLLIDGKRSFEATLVLRTVLQDENRRWVQAGAGVIAQSNPERELIETGEKLESIAPYVVAE